MGELFSGSHIEPTVRDYYQRLFAREECQVISMVEFVSVEMAKDFLSRNDDNRPKTPGIARKYARLILDGQWMVNGEAILISRTNRLLDGQHRLQAVLEVGFAVPMLVTRGLDPECFITLNTGKIRSGSDALSILGEKNSAVVAGVCRLWHLYEQYGLGSSTASSRKPSNTELVRILNKHPQIRESVAYVKARAESGFSAVIFSFLHHICSLRSPDIAPVFFEKALTGANCSAVEPAFHLYRRLKESSGASSRLQQFYVLAIAIKAWNMNYQGRAFKNVKGSHLSWRAEEGYPQLLPYASLPDVVRPAENSDDSIP